MWLLSQGRREDALRALCWLRGWVSSETVQSEFDEIVRYSLASKISYQVPRKTQNYSYSNEISLSSENSLNSNVLSKSNDISNINAKDNNKNISEDMENRKKEDSECKTIKNGVTIEDTLEQDSLPFKDQLADFFRREMMIPMFIVCSFFFFTYCSGMLAIRPYMVPVFMNLGFFMDPYLATVIYYFCLFISKIVYKTIGP